MHILNHVIWEIRLGQEIRKRVYMHCNNLVSGYRKTSHFNLFGQRWAYFKWIGEIWLCRLKNFNQAASERKVSVVRHKQFFFFLLTVSMCLNLTKSRLLSVENWLVYSCWFQFQFMLEGFIIPNPMFFSFHPFALLSQQYFPSLKSKSCTFLVVTFWKFGLDV